MMRQVRRPALCWSMSLWARDDGVRTATAALAISVRPLQLAAACCCPHLCGPLPRQGGGKQLPAITMPQRMSGCWPPVQRRLSGGADHGRLDDDSRRPPPPLPVVRAERYEKRSYSC